MNKGAIYLDNCCFNRPYDDQSHLSIYLETQAKLAIQQGIMDKTFILVWSTMLDFENSSNLNKAIRTEIFNWRARADKIIHQTQNIIKTASNFQKIGIHNRDAIHIACAVSGNALYFITTDNGILKKNTKIKEINIINPVDFIRMMEEQDEI